TGMVPNNNTGVTNTTRPFTNIVVDGAGVITGKLTAQGATAQAGIGSLNGFSAAFRGSFIVPQGWSSTFHVGRADGFLFGVGNGATRVNGIYVNAPSSGKSVFAQYPLMAANNGPSTGAPAPVVVSFLAAGTYPYEFDYRSGTGGSLSLAVTVTQGTSTE